MDKHNHEHVCPEERKIDGWRFYRARGGRVESASKRHRREPRQFRARAVTSGSGR